MKRFVVVPGPEAHGRYKNKYIGMCMFVRRRDVVSTARTRGQPVGRTGTGTGTGGLEAHTHALLFVYTVDGHGGGR